MVSSSFSVNSPSVRWLVRVGAACLVALAFTGCSRDVLRAQLTEDQANDIAGTLLQANIDVRKEFRDKAWSVLVRREDMTQSLAIMRQYGLPRAVDASGCEAFKKDSMVSSPTEDRARLMCYYSHRIERAVMVMDGVMQVVATVSLPDKDPLADKQAVARASVTVKHIPTARVDIDKVKQIAFDSVSGMTSEHISVVTIPSEPSLSTQSKGAAGAVGTIDTRRVAGWLAAIAGLVLIVGGGFVAWQRYKDGAAKTRNLPAVVPAAKPGVGDD